MPTVSRLNLALTLIVTLKAFDSGQFCNAKTDNETSLLTVGREF